MEQFLSVLASYWWVLLLVIVGLWFAFSSVIVVGGTALAYVERRWFGKKMPPDRVIAFSGEVGVQARTFGPGIHLIWPFIYRVWKSQFVTIKNNEVGHIEALAGNPMPMGRVFGEPVAGHNYFQDGEAFLQNGGQKGPQLDILPPGPYRINPILFKVTPVNAITIGETQVGLIESKDGDSVPPGRVFAKVVSDHNLFQDAAAFLRNGGQKGPQLQILPPGKWRINQWLFTPTTVDVIDIGELEIGLVESCDGAPVEPGHIFAKVVSGHNLFQDGWAFLQNGGEKGPQMQILPPGRYRVNTKLFTVTPVAAVQILKGQIGVVTSSDGKPIPNGRLLGCHVDDHSNFEDGEAFLKNGGQKGPQVDILLPGTYRINTAMFRVEVKEATVIPAEKVGQVTAKDGEMLPPREYIAASVVNHNDYQDGEAFLKNKGQRGPQYDVLKPGTYYINPMMFDVKMDDVAQVERGQVAVVVSNVGALPPEVQEVTEELDAAEKAGDQEKVAAIEQRLNSGLETYVVPDGFKGIQRKVAGPGTYYLNRLAHKAYIVDTTNITIDWADEAGADDPTTKKAKAVAQTQVANGPSAAQSFNPLVVTSKDGFNISVSVKVVIRVRPDQAPYMVAKIGSIDNLINHVIHPMIDSSFRNQASSASAMAFLQDRQEEQVKAEDRARRELEKYHVECVSVLICQIVLPEALMLTQTSKIIAEQQETQYIAQQKAEKERIAKEKTFAEANKQPELVAAEIDVQIAEQNKLKAIKLAEGAGASAEAEAKGKAAAVKLQAEAEGAASKMKGEGTAASIEAIGKATGTAKQAEGEGTAKGYQAQKEAIGGEGIVNIEITKAISDALAKGNIKITPDILVGGSGGEGGGSLAQLITALAAQKLMDKDPSATVIKKS